MNRIKQTESKLLIYQKYVDLIDYGYNLLIKYPKVEKYALTSQIEMKLESNLINIGRKLLSGEYTFSKYFEFTIY